MPVCIYLAFRLKFIYQTGSLIANNIMNFNLRKLFQRRRLYSYNSALGKIM